MSSPKSKASSFNFRMIKLIISWLWPFPIQVRTIGQLGEPLLILPNARACLDGILPEFNRYAGKLRLLVLDTGGMDAACASAFCTVSKEDVLKRVKNETPEGENVNVFLPVSLARRWGLEDGDGLGNYRVCAIPDVIDHWDIEALGVARHAPNVLWTRLKHAPGFWLGQALFFALPLVIFGWQTVFGGLFLLLVASLILALTWDVFPVSGFATSLIVGLFLATLVAFGLPALSQLSNALALRWSIACFIAFAWMGLVFQGLKRG